MSTISKTLQKKKLVTLPLMLVAADDGKFMGYAEVPKAESTKLSAAEWLNTALEVCGGKGGGKAVNAQGQARDGSKWQEAVEAAREFAVKALA